MNERDVKSMPGAKVLPGGPGGGLDALSRWLIRRAAGQSPESLSKRLEEEWLADSAERPSAWSRLRFAIGCCWATRVIAREHAPSRLPLAASAVQGKLAILHAQFNLGFFSRRSSTLFLVASLHLGVFYALMSGLSYTQGSVPPSPLQNQTLKDPQPRDLPLPLPAPHFKSSKIEAPIPDFDLPRQPDVNRDVTTDMVSDTPPSPPPISAPPHVVKEVTGGPGTGFPNPDEFYPLIARHLEEQGIATVRVCVDPSGRLTSDPTTLQGTGSLRLDEGALKLARAGSGHYRATTEDGRPVSSCYPLRIRFQFKQ